MANDHPACATCCFFDRVKPLVGSAPKNGRCRVNAPTFTSGISVWPVVSEADWCGAHPAFRDDPLIQIVDGKVMKVPA